MKNNMMATMGLSYWLSQNKIPLSEVINECFKVYANLPDRATDGGDDKDFFVFYIRNIKLYACRNEIDGLTLMLPSEY